jgi:tetratricopeptide (TPR) repeat protein
MALISLAVSLAAADGWAQATRDSARRYVACMSLARENPERGYRQAIDWRNSGGGQAARHCEAVAILELGLYAEAARQLEGLAGAAAAKGGTLKSDLLGQAASAWMIAGKPDAAYAAQTAALEIAPDDVELLIDRSISLASTRKYRLAIIDLDRALEIDPRRPEALVFRASAYRRLESFDRAKDDIERALVIDPGRPEGLLERGIILHHEGDAKSARRDWLKVLDLAPWSPAAEAARRNIERLDVKVE